MSALGQKRTFCDAEAMSALPPKADILAHRLMSALCQKRTFHDSLNHFISDGQHGSRDREPQTFCRLSIEHELKFCGLKHWQIGGLCALNNARSVGADKPISVG